MQSGHCVAAHAKPPAFMHYFCACSTGFFDVGIEGMLMQRCRTPIRRILAAQLAWPCSSSVAYVCVSHGCLVTGRQTRLVAARAIVAAQAGPYKRMGIRVHCIVLKGLAVVYAITLACIPVHPDASHVGQTGAQ